MQTVKSQQYLHLHNLRKTFKWLKDILNSSQILGDGDTFMQLGMTYMYLV